MNDLAKEGRRLAEMLADILAQVGQAGTVVVGSFGIYVALRNQRRQLNAQMFIEFSGRFQKLLREFPTEAWLANRSANEAIPPSSQELTDCTLYTIQFVYDVYHLHKNGFIAKNLWTLWEREIKNTLSGRVFQREWERVAAEFAHSPEFVQYINAIMRCKPSPSAASAGSSSY
jgi:hypothetical protein